MLQLCVLRHSVRLDAVCCFLHINRNPFCGSNYPHVGMMTHTALLYTANAGWRAPRRRARRVPLAASPVDPPAAWVQRSIGLCSLARPLPSACVLCFVQYDTVLFRLSLVLSGSKWSRSYLVRNSILFEYERGRTTELMYLLLLITYDRVPTPYLRTVRRTRQFESTTRTYFNEYALSSSLFQNVTFIE